MTIGVGILLFVIGAILAFAVDVDLQVIDGVVLGYILMLAGIVVALASLAMTRRNRTETVVERPREERVVERRSERGDTV